MSPSSISGSANLAFVCIVTLWAVSIESDVIRKVIGIVHTSW